MKIKPSNPNVPVRDPITRKPLAAKGEEKPDVPYWQRRIIDGDVIDMNKKTGGKA